MDWKDKYINKVVCGDCLELMKELPDESVDLVVTDPPWNIGKNYGSQVNDNRDPKEYWRWIDNVFCEIYRIMKAGYLYVSHSDKGIYKAKTILENIGFEYIQTLIWWGKNGYSMQLHRKSWSYRHEPILFMQKGDPPVLEVGKKGMWYTSVFDVPRPQSNFKEGRFHPTQKPIKLYQNIIQRTPGEIVMDPFIGVGTTALACLLTGRNFIGMEINPDYVAIANRRIKEELQQLKLDLR